MPDDWVKTELSQVEIAAMPPIPVEWDVTSLIERDSGPVLLFGEPEHYKSWIALHIAQCVAVGKPVFGVFATNARPKSTYLNFDAGRRATMRRFQKLTPTPHLILNSPEGGFHQAKFERYADASANGFFIMDCFTDMYHGDTVDANPMRDFIRRDLRDVFERNSCNGVVVDHSKRAQPGDGGPLKRLHGSVQKQATFRQIIHCELVKITPEAPAKAKRIRLTSVKLSEAEKFAPFYVRLTWTNGIFDAEFDGLVSDESLRADNTETHVAKVLAFMGDDPDVRFSRAEIAKGSGLGKTVVCDALKELQKSKRVIQHGDGRSTAYSIAA